MLSRCEHAATGADSKDEIAGTQCNAAQSGAVHMIIMMSAFTLACQQDKTCVAEKVPAHVCNASDTGCNAEKMATLQRWAVLHGEDMLHAR